MMMSLDQGIPVFGMGVGGLVLLALAVAFAMLWHRGGGGFGTGPAPESAEDILRRRLASGEISRAEYQSLLEELRR